MIPTFKFHGSKARIAKWVFERITTVDNYYEPFAGRGNTYFYAAVNNLVNNDAFLNDLYMAHFLIALRDYAGDYSFIPDYIDREVFEYFNNMPQSFERSLAESFCAYNGTFFGGGANITNNPHHKSKNRHSKLNTTKRMIIAKQLLNDVVITNLDYIEFLSSKSFTSGDLIYCDPPYLQSQNSKLRNMVIDHERLTQILSNVPCKVILSGYDNQTYDKILGWNKREFIRASCGRNSNGTSHKATEFVWENF